MYKVSHCVYPIIFLHWKFNSFREISFLNFTVMYQFIIRCVTIIWPFYMLVLSGCAGWSTVKYPKPILLDGAADVSVQYSHDHISIHVPLQIPGDRPTALQVKIFHHSDSVDPSLEHLFFLMITSNFTYPNRSFPREIQTTLHSSLLWVEIFPQSVDHLRFLHPGE